jgi:hypothetical protein
MLVVHRVVVQPALRQGGDLHWRGDAGARRAPLVTLTEKLASRDYTYLLLLCALLGHLEWFLYGAAAGAWLFTAGLLGYRAYAGPSCRRPVASA